MCGRGAASRRRQREQLVDLEQTILDRDDLGGLLVDEVLAEPVLAVHLEHEPSEVPDALLAVAEEHSPLAAERARGRKRAAPRTRRRLGVRLVVGRTCAAESFEQRRHPARV